MQKKKSTAFGKDVYLVGKTIYDEVMWLEAPSWDCGWYWGFGYLEVYTTPNNPARSKDITHHTHWDTVINEHGLGYFIETPFSKEEGIELQNLFASFYAMKKAAANAHQNDPAYHKKVNEEVIPNITAKIIAILTPK